MVLGVCVRSANGVICTSLLREGRSRVLLLYTFTVDRRPLLLVFAFFLSLFTLTSFVELHFPISSTYTC